MANEKVEVVKDKGGKPGKDAPKDAKSSAPGKDAPKTSPVAKPAPAPAPAPAPVPKAPKAPKAPKPAPVVKPRTNANSTNVMRKLKVAKVTVNIGVGQGGERLEKAEKVLANLTGMKPVRTMARKAIRDWNVREGTPIGVKVTLRGDQAVSFTKRALWTRNFRIANWSFDQEGNLLFGVPDHTSFEGQKYNPEVGIFGMDIAVTVERPGFRLKHRRLVTRKVSPRHRVDRIESQAFLKELLGLEIV
jgi:large subunit ribosomal protein L5